MSHFPSATFLGLLSLAGLLPGQDASQSYDLLLRGGRVVDGTGGEPYVADVAVRGDRIAAIGDLAEARATRSIDARGLVVAPGFVDVHTHADNTTSRPEAINFVSMGVTTIITGNCGYSGSDLDETFSRLEKTGVSPNFASLIGHGTVRTAVLGSDARAPTPNELEAMRDLVRRAMRAGAVGLSTGLIYVPGTYAETEEIVALARVVGEFGGVYASHIRNENDHVVEAVDEAVRIGNEAGVKVQISHIKASGKHNWGRSALVIERLRRARAAGSRVTADQYAYDASSTSLDVLFPADELSIGREAFAAKLADDAGFRARMLDAVMKVMERVGFGDLSYCRIADAPGSADLNGMTIAEASAFRHGDRERPTQARTALDLFAMSKGRRISMIYHTMSEDDVARYMREPFVAIASDSGIRLRKTTGLPHPRGAGNNPRVLARYVRERGILSLPLAVQKMTSLPAEVFGLEDRGVVRVGAFADLTLFDAETVQDKATFDAPLETPAGMPWVVVNGVVVVENGEHTGARPGSVLRHRSPAAKAREER